MTASEESTGCSTPPVLPEVANWADDYVTDEEIEIEHSRVSTMSHKAAPFLPSKAKAKKAIPSLLIPNPPRCAPFVGEAFDARSCMPMPMV